MRRHAAFAAGVLALAFLPLTACKGFDLPGAIGTALPKICETLPSVITAPEAQKWITLGCTLAGILVVPAPPPAAPTVPVTAKVGP